MANILDDVEPEAGQVHALVVGTSVYPAADPDLDDPKAKHYGVETLTSAARSASEFAAWLLDEYSEREKLASLRVLLSPSDGEQIHPTIAARLPAEGARATLAAFEDDFEALQWASRFPESTVIVYLAGHGVQVSQRGATVLLEDYLADARGDLLRAAVDVIGCHEALDGHDLAQTQFWFVDACRQTAAAGRRFETLGGGWAPRDRPLGDARVSPVFLAASPREQAFATVGGTSLFNQALDWVLDGHAAHEPGPLCERWHVSIGSLIDELAPRVTQLAGAHRTEQLVDVTGRVNPGVLHQFDDRPALAGRVADPPAVGPAVVGEGTIEVRFDLPSYLLGTLMPWQVTTQERVVGVGFGPGLVPVAAGTYFVGCALPDGSKPMRTVEVVAGGTETVTFDAERSESAPFEATPSADEEDGVGVVEDETRVHGVVDETRVHGDAEDGEEAMPAGDHSLREVAAEYVRGLPRMLERSLPSVLRDGGRLRTGWPTRPARPSETAPEPSSGSDDPDQPETAATKPEVSAVQRATMAEQVVDDGRQWAFQPADDLSALPIATVITHSGRRLEISLPVNPRSGYPLNSCTIATSAARDLHIRFAPERQVASALATFIETNSLASSVDLFEGASDALLGKYSDPAGAALGGLTLHRLGRLKEKAAWVENLARDFLWLPDGAILLAALQRADDDADERARGVETLLEATTKRPLYIDGLALAVDLLRRWDDPSSQSSRLVRLESLGALLADADQNQIFLTTAAN